MIKLIVFDMAGTTVDEQNVVYRTVLESINAAGYSFTQQQVQAMGAGKEKSQAIRDVLSLDGEDHSDEEVNAIFAQFKQRLEAAYADLDVREQPGTSELFAELRRHDVKIVLNTGYDRRTAESLIGKLGWEIGREIDGLVTASDVQNGRPAPDMIHRAMELTNVSSPQRVAKVGDSCIDIEEGHNAKCGVTLGVTTGAQTDAQLQQANPTAVIDGIEQVSNFCQIH